MNLRKITAIASVFATTLPALIAAPVFAEESSSTTTDPAVELTAGKDSDKEAKVSKGDQALTDNSKSKDKESDKNTTVLKKQKLLKLLKLQSKQKLNHRKNLLRKFQKNFQKPVLKLLVQVFLALHSSVLVL